MNMSTRTTITTTAATRTSADDRVAESRQAEQRQPVELSLEMLKHVAGGGPNGNWLRTKTGPNGNW